VQVPSAGVIGDILQPTHLLFVLIVALVVLGPKRLPEVAKSLGNSLRDFRGAINGESHEPDTIHDAVPVPEPATEPIRSDAETSVLDEADGTATIGDEPPPPEQPSTTDSQPLADATIEPDGPPEAQPPAEPESKPPVDPSPESEPKLDTELTAEHRT
jgi:sec-independent protein translocase protein TatA